MERKDIFISYKSEDFDQANWLRSVLEANGFSCWMAPASIPGGSNYAREIPQAIDQCRVFVLALTQRCQDSIWVPKELDRAINSGKIIMPFMLENCALTDDFNFYLSNVQRYNAYQNKAAAVERMLRDLQALLDAKEIPERNQPVAEPKKERVEKGKWKKLLPVVAAVLAVCLLAALLPKWMGGKNDVFADIQITVEGAAPHASVTVQGNPDDPFLRSIRFTVTPDRDLKLGDTVTITAEISQEEAKENGYRMKSNTIEYTLEKMPSYITDVSLLKAADVNALQEKMEKYINGHGSQFPRMHLQDGSDLDLAAEKLANCLADFEVLEKGYVYTYTPMFDEQIALVLPFCLSLEDVPYNWVGTTYYDEPVYQDYPALYGYFQFTDLLLDEEGNLIKEGRFGMEMSDLYENRDVMEMELSKRLGSGELVSGVLQK